MCYIVRKLVTVAALIIILETYRNQDTPLACSDTLTIFIYTRIFLDTRLLKSKKFSILRNIY